MQSRRTLSDNELRDRLVSAITLLKIPGVGIVRYHRLTKTFGDPASVLSSSIGQLETVPGISRAISGAIKKQQDTDKARELAGRIAQLGWSVLFADDPDYPKTLLSIRDYPPILFRIGEPSQDDEKHVAIVGTRRCTEKGRLFTFNLARSLAQAEITVVSGMAEGIDSAAHAGALEADGKTVAVWGCSLETVYPPSNKSLAEAIKKNGAVYSEYLPGTSPDRTTFPERNRIISGMVEAVVVVEAGQKSGALITAQRALDHGRELFAVPGPPNSRSSQGTNNLIKAGAKLTTRIDDIFDELPRLKGEVLVKKFRGLPDMTETERNIVSFFSEGTQQLDQLANSAGMPVSELMEFLLALELKGVVKELSGKRFMLSEEFT